MIVGQVAWVLLTTGVTFPIEYRYYTRGWRASVVPFVTGLAAIFGYQWLTGVDVTQTMTWIAAAASLAVNVAVYRRVRSHRLTAS